MAAQTSREKKKKYLNGLEETVSKLQKKNDSLMAQLRVAQAENDALRAAQGGDLTCKSAPVLPLKTPVVTAPSLPPLEAPSLASSTGMNFSPITVKTEPSLGSGTQTPLIAFESAEFYYRQQLEVIRAVMIFLLSAWTWTFSLLLLLLSPPASPSRRTPSPAPSPSTLAPRKISILSAESPLPSSKTCPTVLPLMDGYDRWRKPPCKFHITSITSGRLCSAAAA